MDRKKFRPREYQSLIIDYQHDRPRSAIWAGMGTGKTAATLTAISEAQQCGESHPTLVLAPLLVAKETWPSEARLWSHLSALSVMPVVGTAKERLRALAFDASVYTTNYEALPWLIDHYKNRWPFGRVIADESTRLKSFRLRQGGSRAQALAKVAHTHVRNFIELTGTPSPNGLLDLWGQIWFLDGGKRLGRSFTAYRDRYFRIRPDGFGYDALPQAQDLIHNAIADVCLTIRSEDWFDLQEPFVVNRFVDLPIRARGHYKEMEDRFFTELSGRPVEAVNGASKSQKLLQIANGAVYVDPLTESDDAPIGGKEWREVHDVKIQALENIVNEFNGEPLLVAFHFKSDRERLLKAFPKATAMSARNANDTVRDWNAGKIPMLLVHPASAGHGLSLQHGGRVLVYFGHYWNLEHRQQVLERIGPVRQQQSGYDRTVYVINIIARDTIDELVLKRVETKATVQELLLEAMAKWKR